MGKVFVRVDDRLIHGQIVTAWCQTLGIRQIIAIDDELAANPMLQTIMTMGVPTQYNPKIVTVADAKTLLADGSDTTRLVIVRFAKVLAQLREALAGAQQVNLGNSSKLGDSVYQFSRGGAWYVYLSQADWDALEALAADGIPIISQNLPTEKLVDWTAIKKAVAK